MNTVDKVVKIWKGDLMMRSKSLAKNKDLQRKVLCSLLAAGVMSVCIPGGDVWASGTIKDQDMIITSNMDIVADDGEFEGVTKRYAAIGHTQDSTMTVTAKPGVMVDSVVTATNGRAMGIVNVGNGVLNVNGNYSFALNADTVRGIRNNGYNDLNLNGDFIIKAVSKGKNSNNDVVVGVEAFNGTNITVNGDKLNIDITTDNARIIGVQNFNNNGETITFNSNDTSIKAVQIGTGSVCQGVLAYQSTTNFNGNVVIDLKADQVTDQVHGIDIQCDPGNSYETVVNFNNQKTDIKVEGGAGYDVAYVSISLTNPKVPGSRASGEQPALPAESAINELYVITFDAGKVVTKDEKATKYATVLGSGSFGTNSGVTTPNTPVKVDPNTKYLLVIANPGYQLKDRLDNLSEGATYATINAMVTVPENNTKPNNAYLVEEVVHSNGCAMINVGFYDDSDSDPSNHAWKDECLLDVSDKIVLVSDYKSEAQAQNAAKSNPATLEIERLAAKLEVMIGSPLAVGPFEDGTNASLGQFDFGNWTIDYYNSLFYPFAKKTTTASSHTTGFYKSNFYTVDPNFTTAGGTEYLTGIVKNTLDANREPKVEWVAESADAGDNYKYCIENTMAEGYQKFGAATRLVLKGQYAPWKSGEFTLGDDWYRLPNGTNSVNFKSFADLLAAYTPAKAKQTNSDPMTAQEKLLVTACELFYTQIQSELTTHDPGSFALLTQTILDDNNIKNGGELCKKEGCIYWYPKSLNYYYYEIRHDNAANSYMEYGKYGVVRNNYYTLTLTKVNGNGTPWYPGGGPEDPDEEEDIDKKGAYLHFEIKVAPWIYWTTNFEI